MGQAVFCSLLRRGLERFRVEFVREGVEALAYMNDITRGLMAVTANTVSALLVLQFELDGIGIVVNFTKTVAVALPPTGHVSTTEEEMSLLEVHKPES